MDFFEAQDTARRKSSLLVFLFLAAVVMIVGVVYLAVVGAMAFASAQMEQHFDGWWQPRTLGFVAAGIVALIALGSLFKTLSLRSGGGVVARSLGGVAIDRQTKDPAQRRLLNIVEEMSIASGVRIPDVYVLPENGINAFAAGYTPDDAAVAVTKGALDNLSRDELQGVVAHEFSHILNGDMRLNIRLIGLLFGILLLAVVGRTFLHGMRFSRLSSGRNRNAGGVAIAIVLAAVALILVGYIGVLFGRLIQAAVSRQREYLADAAAVQFSRNPHGIAGALKKIGAAAGGSRVENAHTTETSHLFFANALRGSALNVFATHPPLVERIRAIDPSFDGDFAKVAADARRAVKPETDPSSKKRQAPPPIPVRPAAFLAAIAAADLADPAAGAAALQEVPEALHLGSRDPRCARGLILALLYGPDPAAGEKQRKVISAALDQSELDACAPLFPLIQNLSHTARFTLIDLCLPTVRQLPKESHDRFINAIDEMIAADNQTTLFEFAVRQMIVRSLLATGKDASGPAFQTHSFAPLAADIGLVLSAIAHAGAATPEAAQAAFEAGLSRLQTIRTRLSLSGRHELNLPLLARALDNLDRAVPPIKKAVMAAAAEVAAEDETIKPAELELLRAIAAALHCPAPPAV